jgi:lysophospholipase L1-like esterase
MLKNSIAFLASILFSILILELFLHIYNPFEPRIKGNQIQLPVHKKYEIHNDRITKLSPEIIHTRNGLGFRGPELPDDFESKNSIICVGGSTTECYYLSDGQDWPAQLMKALQPQIPNLWINNAGLDGHSTWGHKLLIEQHILELKPKYLLLLSGINDVGREDIGFYDTKQYKVETSSAQGFKNFILQNSQLLNTIKTIRRGLKAIQKGVGHSDMNIHELSIVENQPAQIDSAVDAHQQMIEKYKQRLIVLTNLCKQNGITPILITQPMLWGDTIDPETQVYLGNIEITPESNSLMRWKILQAYNEGMKNVASQHNIAVIDLANTLPKSSLYFYDEIHFTPQGSQAIAEILKNQILKQNLIH